MQASITHITLHESWECCKEHLTRCRLFAISTRGKRRYNEITFIPSDVFVFGPENFPEQNRLRLPMLPHNRSLNLANAAAIVVYEAWRQAGFKGGQ
jgi:tRNA (cytidine/uridine-2'-O-)-methyltransferase